MKSERSTLYMAWVTIGMIFLAILVAHSVARCTDQEEIKFDARAMKGEAKYRALMALKEVER
jgi:hypothetical protein